MSSLLKDIYSPSFYRIISKAATIAVPGFPVKKFEQSIFTKEFEKYELKQRMWHTADVLTAHLSPDYPKAAKQVCAIIDVIEEMPDAPPSFGYMFFPEIIARQGLNHLKDSVQAMERITKFCSCEFAVRPFFLRYEQEMIQQSMKWAAHAHRGVRRLATEGSRPRLPWGMAIPSLKKDPRPLLPVLEKLKTDECEIVRRSVANHLNDISKDHPDLMISIARKWKGESEETDAIIKHACRTLFKAGNPEVLKLYQLKSNHLQVSDFTLQQKQIKRGEAITFDCLLENQSTRKSKVRLEYAVYFRLKNGNLSKKVFKISEREINGKEQMTLTKRHAFKPITTRVYYPGVHEISVIVNGEEKAKKSFRLI